MKEILRDESQRTIVFGVTTSQSAYSFLRGQLSWFAARGWRTLLAVSPDEKAIAAAEREGVKLVPTDMARGISPVMDLNSLFNWIRFLRR